MFIDSHAHLEGKRYDSDRDEVLARAKQNGIEAYLAIGNGEGPDTANCGIQLAEEYSGKAEYPEIWASVGVHPHEASLADDASYSQLEQWARHPKVIAWERENDIVMRSKTPQEATALVARQHAFFDQWKKYLVSG